MGETHGGVCGGKFEYREGRGGGLGGCTLAVAKPFSLMITGA